MTRFAAIACALMLTACMSLPATGEDSAAVTFIVIRHAEKADDDARDPSISEAGHVRARQLEGILAGQPLVAVYATQYRRTRQTVQPAADAHGVPVATYDASLPASRLANDLKSMHREGAVLVAGHSNTVPAIVAALCACEAEAMPESEYDRISIVRIASGVGAQLETVRYPAGEIAP